MGFGGTGLAFGGEEAGEGLTFVVLRGAGEAELEGEGDAGVVGFGFLDEAGGEGLGELDVGAVVEEGEGLERGVAADAAGAGAEAVGGIEDTEGGRWGGAEDEGVDGAAIAVCAFAEGPGAFDLTEGKDAFGDGGINWGTAHLGGEEAAGGEADIAHDFGVEAEAVLAPEEVVVGIGGGRIYDF